MIYENYQIQQEKNQIYIGYWVIIIDFKPSKTDDIIYILPWHQDLKTAGNNHNLKSRIEHLNKTKVKVY